MTENRRLGPTSFTTRLAATPATLAIQPRRHPNSDSNFRFKLLSALCRHIVSQNTAPMLSETCSNITPHRKSEVAHVGHIWLRPQHMSDLFGYFRTIPERLPRASCGAAFFVGDVRSIRRCPRHMFGDVFFLCWVAPYAFRNLAWPPA